MLGDLFQRHITNTPQKPFVCANIQNHLGGIKVIISGITFMKVPAVSPLLFKGWTSLLFVVDDRKLKFIKNRL